MATLESNLKSSLTIRDYLQLVRNGHSMQEVYNKVYWIVKEKPDSTLIQCKYLIEGFQGLINRSEFHRYEYNLSEIVSLRKSIELLQETISTIREPVVYEILESLYLIHSELTAWVDSVLNPYSES